MATLSDSWIATQRDTAYDLRGQAVTVQAPVVSTVDFVTGDITESFISTSVSKALLGPVITLKGSDKRRSCGIRVSDVSGIAVDYRVVIDGTVWFVKSVRFDATEFAQHLILETS